MKKATIFTMILCLILIVVSCEHDTGLVPATKIDDKSPSSASNIAELIAKELTEMNGWAVETNSNTGEEVQGLQKSAGYYIQNFQKEQITGNVYHYKFQVRTGPGPYDIIGIHRVVKDKWFGLPIRTRKSIFFLHGDAKDFEGIFLPGTLSPSTPNHFGLAVYLAEHNVDVWGIDQAWTLVPEGTADLSFMQDWGMQRQIDDLSYGIRIARFTRMFSGCGLNKMILSGYSSGVLTGYALLNEETQRPGLLRQVNGFIPVDFNIKLDDPYLKQFFGDLYASLQDAINNGIYHEDVPFKPIGALARNDPDGASPILEGFTNLQAALFFGAGQIFGMEAIFHYLAGDLEDGLPVSLKFVTNEQWFDFLETAPPYEPYPFELDYCALLSELVDVPYDDYLARIEVPIFNVAAAGGCGDLSIYGTTLLGSADITHLIASSGASSLEEEFGHIDIFIADNAPTLVWTPILQWINSHSCKSIGPAMDDLVFDVD